MTNRWRIVVPTFELAPIYIGGLGTMLTALYGNLDPERFEPVLVLPRSGYTWPGEPVRRVQHARCEAEIHYQDGMEIQLLCNEILDRHPIYPAPDNWVGIKKIDEFGERVAELMPDLRPDLLHLHDHYGYKALLEARLRGVPSVYTVHRIHHEFSQWLLCEHVAVRMADRVTTVGRSYREENAAFFAAAQHPAHVIPNGCELAFWRLPDPQEPAAQRAERRARLCERHGLSPGVTLAYLGRLNADQKGVDLLLDAVCRQLRDVDVRLLVIGEGDAQITAALRRAEAEAPHRCRFENRLYPPAGVRDLLSAVDMLVVPSRYEPFGLVQIEAMAMGALPVVAATGGLRDVAVDVAHDHGFAKVFPPGDADALAQAIREMCHVATTEPDRFHRWRDRAIHQAGKHSARNMANAYAELYRSMIAT